MIPGSEIPVGLCVKMQSPGQTINTRIAPTGQLTLPRKSGRAIRIFMSAPFGSDRKDKIRPESVVHFSGMINIEDQIDQLIRKMDREMYSE
jgi:hypothetical protein